MNEALHLALDRIDDLHRRDPRVWSDEDSQPYELAYAQRVTKWVTTLQPDASDDVLLAARAMHLGRWMKPRSTYAAGLNGYLQWRADLQQHHAELAGNLLHDLGFVAERIARVQSLIRKEHPDDPDTRLLEDALCLVFLEHQLAEFATRHPQDKVVDILNKTWAKMSAQGHEAARRLRLPSDLALLLDDLPTV